MLGVALLVAGTAAWAISSDAEPDHRGPAATGSENTTSEAPATQLSSEWRGRLDDALRRGVAAANAYGGEAEAGLWLDNAATGIEVGDRLGPGRLWSLSKLVVALAAIEAAETQGGPTPALMVAITDAITRSDNCAQRQVVLDLQQRQGGTDGAQAAFDAVLTLAGVTLSTKPQRADISGDPGCRSYLAEFADEITDPFGTALQFGTDEWTLHDTLLFAHALANGTYGDAGETVLRLMRKPKARPAGASETDYTAALSDPPSSGRFPDEWAPAYKGGWGGHRLNPPNFRTAEIVVLDVGGHRVALAAVFRPTLQPRSDDPGVTQAPDALNVLFATIEQALTEITRGEQPRS